MVPMEVICQLNLGLVWAFSTLLILPDTLEVSFLFKLDSSTQGKWGWAATQLQERLGNICFILASKKEVGKGVPLLLKTPFHLIFITNRDS